MTNPYESPSAEQTKASGPSWDRIISLALFFWIETPLCMLVGALKGNSGVIHSPEWWIGFGSCSLAMILLVFNFDCLFFKER